MAEPDKQQIGEGSDSYGSAARNAGKAIRQAGQNAAKESAQKGAEAAANAAAHTVKAGAKVGKAASEIAAGTAVGGPWGAIISAAWSMRHTLFKILVCICLAVLFIVITVVALPDILIQNIKNVFNPDEQQSSVVEASYADLAAIVTASVDQGHRMADAEIKRLIADGGYDRELSLANVTDLSAETRNHDICCILAAYSVAADRNEISRENLIYRLSQATDRMFPVRYEVRATQITVTEGENQVERTVYYLASTIESFQISAIYDALLIDPDAAYGDTGTTYGEIIEFYTMSLENTLNFGGIKVDEKETNKLYAIPANYTDSGRLFGGMLAARNAVEALILTVILGFAEIKLIPMPTTVRVVVMVLTILPTALIAMMGIDGQSLTQYLGHILRFIKNKRKLHYVREEAEYEGEE